MDERSEEEAVDCLISCSCSCYHSTLSGPRLQHVLNGVTPSGWENVRPLAIYDLTNLHCPDSNHSPRRRRIKRNLGSLFTSSRGTISLPNLRTRAAVSLQAPVHHKEFRESYMSGCLDENFSYTYPGGLSDKSGAIEEHKLHKESPTHHYNSTVDPLQKQSSQPQSTATISTHTLTLDTVLASRLYAAQMGRRTRDEISKIIAIQLRPDILAEQLSVETRLRSLDLSAFPVLRTDRGCISSKSDCKFNNLDSFERGSCSSISAPPTYNGATSHAPAQSQQQSHTQRKKRKSRQRKQIDPKSPRHEWCLPPGGQKPQYNHVELHDESQQCKTMSSMHSSHMSVGLRGNGFVGLSSVAGSAATSKHESASAASQIASEKCQKRRLMTYFGQTEFALENSLPKSEQGKQALPVVVPELDFKQHFMRTRQFSSKLTTLHQLPSKFTPNSTLDFANTIS